jgi:phasin family protein
MKPVASKPVVTKKPAAVQPKVSAVVAETKPVIQAVPETEMPPVGIPSEAVEAPVPAAVEPVASAAPSPVVTPAKLPDIKKVIPMTMTPFKGYDDFTAFSKANVEAFIMANQVFAKGIEEMSKEFMSLTQSSVESATAAAKAVFTAKSFKDVVDLNTVYTKTSFDKFVSNSTKLSEMGVKIATDSLAPVTARVNVAVEKMMKPVA